MHEIGEAKGLISRVGSVDPDLTWRGPQLTLNVAIFKEKKAKLNKNIMQFWESQADSPANPTV